MWINNPIGCIVWACQFYVSDIALSNEYKWCKEWGVIEIHAQWAKSPKYNLWLIHGYGESQACFEEVFESALAMEANIFSFDLPGFGGAPLVRSGYEAYIQELAEVIEAQNGDLPCVILGHSMGGVLATSVAARLRMRQIILLVVDSSLSSDQSPITNADIGEVSPQSFKENLLLKLKAQQLAEPDITRLIVQVEASDPEALAYWAEEGVHARVDDRVLKLFVNLTCQKYYLIGEQSFALPIRQRLIDLLAKYLVWFPDAGHWIMLDTPQVFWQRVGELIAQGLYNEHSTSHKNL